MSFARGKALLGTVVAIRVDGLERSAAMAAMDAAFTEVAAIHRCMSFHDTHSDLARLHASRGAPVAVDVRTYTVLQNALAMAEASMGIFDPTVAVQLVRLQRLPRPAAAMVADELANWRDIELLGDLRVRLLKPLLIDLGGIAKGFAVDRALAILRASGARDACVNAGGDLARFGTGSELVLLQTGDEDPSRDSHVGIEVGEHAVATSSAGALGQPHDADARPSHLHGRTRRTLRRARTVSVVAASCCTADALTKVVLADERVGARLLRHFQARAYVFERASGWHACGAT